MRRHACLLALVAAVSMAGSARGATRFLRGDADDDRVVDVGDAFTLVRVLFLDGDSRAPRDALDANDDGALEITDALHLLNFLFRSGPPPHQPFPRPDFDPTPTDRYREGDEFAVLPDLEVEDLYLGPRNDLIVEIENAGPGAVPAGEGLVRVFVDGLLAYERRFEDEIPAGHLVTIETGLRLSGSLRRIAAIVDPDNVVEETNEFQNSRHYTVNPPEQMGPDLVIVDVVQGLQVGVMVRNVGNRESRADLPVEFSIAVDAHRPMNHSVVLETVPLRETVVAWLDPGGTLENGSRVRIELQGTSSRDDLDNTNNLYEEVFPDGASLERYHVLLGIDKIKRNIIWQGVDGVRNYTTWTRDEREDLLAELEILERTSFTDRSLPPPLVHEYGWISAADAWTIYLRHIAHCLWIELHRKVPWRLENFLDSELTYLLDGRTLFVYVWTHDQYAFSSDELGQVSAWNPRISYHFLGNLGLVRATQEKTIFGLTDWMRGYLIHISGADDREELYGYPGTPPVDRILYSLRTAHKAPGCNGTSGLYGGVLRAVNIPVARRTTHFYSNDCTHDGGAHSRPEFLSVDLSMPHGDDPYTALLTPTGAVIPTSDLFYTMDEMRQLFLDPALECSGQGWCNGVGAQASVNTAREHLRLAYESGGDYLLYTYVHDGSEYLDDMLRGQHVGGGVVECAEPFFPATERAAMIQGVEDRLREIGGGDLEAGGDVVISRWAAWGRQTWP